MSKRKATDELSSQSKRHKSSPHQSYLSDLLKPLFPHKIKINGEDTTPQDINQSELFQELVQAYPKLDSSQKQLASFITSQLPKQEAFGHLNLKTEPLRDDKRNRMDAYDLADKSISLAPIATMEEEIPNPLTTLIHEGTHALDDLHMRTYQKEAIDFLAKHLKDKKGKDIPFTKDKGDWYKGAQKILDMPDFLKLYPYKEHASKNIAGSMFNLELPPEGQQKPIVKDYSMAKATLDKLRNEGEPESDLFFSSLSEFPAFAVENLSAPWTVDWKDKRDKKTKATKKVMESPKDNLGRKFLKKLTKGVYRNFHELEPTFATTYPDANKNFLRRLTDLRNKDKHPERGNYKTYLMNSGLIPNPEA